MAHIHTAPGEHDITVGAYLFRLDGAEPRIMLHEHVKLGKLMQFGGHIELQETPWQALLREVEEESGYSAQELHVLQPAQRLTSVSGGVAHPLPANISTYPYGGTDSDHSHTDLAYVLTVNDTPRLLPGEGESQKLHLLSQTELRDLPDSQILPSVRELGLFAFGLVGLWHPVAATEYTA